MEYETSRMYLAEFTERGFLAKGSFGVVARFRSKLDQKEYAIKKVCFECAECAGINSYLSQREVEALSAMDHPNIVQYFESWVEPKMYGLRGDLNKEDVQSVCLYILMEYCPSNCLEGLERGKALKIFKQIVEAVEHIHQRGFVHLDLSSVNIFLDQYGNAKVGDFVLAQALDDNGKVTITNYLGNPVYKTPEYKKRSTVDAKVDLFSLGILLVELLNSISDENECLETLSYLKYNGLYDDYVDEYAPALCKLHGDVYDPLINKLVSYYSEDRPTTAEVLSQLEENGV